jgi:hypothetical protein
MSQDDPSDRLQDPTDPLSSLGRKLLKLDASAYAALVGSGNGNPTARDLLDSIQPGDLIHGNLARPDEARAMLAGLWLYFDWLEPSHAISQSLETPTGSFWHAILHRREGDFSNSKYWYARCANHPAMPAIGAMANTLINSRPADKSLLRLTMPDWSPRAFVDLVEAVHEKPDDPRYALAVSLQRIEWQVLFDHCTRQAAGG